MPKIDPGSMNYGAVTSDDWAAICRSIELAVPCFVREAGIFLEVGTLSGGTTLGILRVLDLLRVPAPVTTVDKVKGAGLKLTERLKTYKSHSLCTFACGISHEVIRTIEEPIAWAFIDGCHCEECVMQDIQALLPRLLPGGVVVFHDADERNRASGMTVHPRYHGDGVVRLYGVTKAIKDNLPEDEFKLIEKVPAIDRPQPAPTPYFGGVMVFQRRQKDG